MSDDPSRAASGLAADDCPRAGGMPMLGLGTWRNTDPRQCRETVRTAIETGYRHVDTAQAYGNEASVGAGVEAAAVDREEVFLATKLRSDELGHDDALAAARDRLDLLEVDRIDLLYVHWPAGDYDPEGTLAAFDELYDEGLVDRVGVSNFEPDQLAEAVDRLDAPLFANQIECHPLLPRPELRAACETHGVEVVAYSPLARGRVFEVPAVGAVAEKHGATGAQVSLAWLREHGVTAIPKATGETHVRENWASLALDLDAEDVDRLDGIDRRERQVDPGFAPWN